MIFEIKGVEGNPATSLRRAGYSYQHRVGGAMSFVRPLARVGYPRFHAYVKSFGTTITVNLHLDQKKETYGEDSNRHHGEYENEGMLKEEAGRMKSIIEKLK